MISRTNTGYIDDKPTSEHSAEKSPCCTVGVGRNRFEHSAPTGCSNVCVSRRETPESRLSQQENGSRLVVESPGVLMFTSFSAFSLITTSRYPFCDRLFFIVVRWSAIYFSTVERTISLCFGEATFCDYGKCAPIPCCLAVGLLVARLPGPYGLCCGHRRCGFVSARAADGVHLRAASREIWRKNHLTGRGRGDSGPRGATDSRGDLTVAVRLSGASVSSL